MVYDELFSTGSLTLCYRTGEKSACVSLQPSGKRINFKYFGNHIEFVVPTVEVYDIVKVIPR